MTRDDIIKLALEAGFCKDSNGIYSRRAVTPDSDLLPSLERFAALVAAAEQRPISDVTEAVTKTVIEVEKLLCEKIGRQWQPSGMSIQTLVDELATLVAAAEREACAKLCDELRDEDGFEPYGTECAAAIRARGET